MVLIAGAILINAACVLMATNKDTLDVYACQRVFLAAGVAFVVGDLTVRVRQFLSKNVQPSTSPHASTTA